MKFVKAKSDFLLGKYLESAKNITTIEHDGKTYLASEDWGDNNIYITKKQLGNREILRTIIAKGSPKIMRYASNSVLTDFNAMEEFVEQNIRTFAYFDYNHARNCSDAQLLQFVLNKVEEDPTIVLDRMKYINKCEADRNCDFVLTNNKILGMSLNKFVSDCPVDVLDNLSYQNAFKEVYAGFMYDNPSYSIVAFNELKLNKKLDKRFNDRENMKNLLNSTYAMGKISIK